MVLVTGCAGFIRSDFVLSCLAVLDELLVNLNFLTYIGGRKDLASLAENRQYILCIATSATLCS